MKIKKHIFAEKADEIHRNPKVNKSVRIDLYKDLLKQMQTAFVGLPISRAMTEDTERLLQICDREEGWNVGEGNTTKILHGISITESRALGYLNLNNLRGTSTDDRSHSKKVSWRNGILAYRGSLREYHVLGFIFPSEDGEFRYYQALPKKLQNNCRRFFKPDRQTRVTFEE